MAKTRESAEEPGGVGFWGLCLPAGSLGPSLKDCFGFLLCTGGSAAALRIKGLAHQKCWNQYASAHVTP